MKNTKKAFLFLAPLAGAAAVFTTELYRYTFGRNGSKLLNPILDKKGHLPDYYEKRDAAAARLRERPSEKLEIRSPRGNLLRGRYYPLGGEGKRIAFLIHGYRSEHAEAAGFYLDYYASRGIDLFCCDNTAHGESEGRLIGFDAYECEDCLAWVDALIERFGPELQLILHGFSMGAATVLKMSSRCPVQVRFLVSDSGFVSAEEQLKGSFGPLYPAMRGLNRLIAGYDLRETDVRPALKASSKPILFVHGREDHNVEFSHGQRLYDFYQGPKDCLFVDNARHVESMYRDPAGYVEKLDRMLEAYMPRPLRVPDSIQELINGKPYEADGIGMSGSKILLFDDMVLKIVRYRPENEETVAVMRWLEGKLPVPKVLCYERDEEFQYLLMSRVPGKMSCDAYYLEHPQELLEKLTEALRLLWRVDISDCPRNRDLDAELKEARYRVDHNMVDPNNVEPETFGPGGFENPEALLAWLEAHRPAYEPVLSHGDFCLPNVFIENGEISGFIDLGAMGIGDKWRDIALCWRSLKHNFDGSYGGKIYPDFDPDCLFDALGIEPDREKLKYYLLLDELF